MRTSRFVLVAVTLGLCGVWLGETGVAAPKYPFVLEMTGKVSWTNKLDEEGKLKPKQVLIEKASLQTADKSQVVVQLDAYRQMRILPNSQIRLPAISWETGEAPLVELRSGSLRWREEPGKKHNIVLRSELFEFLSPEGDYIFSYDPKKALAEVKVIAGRMEFSAMNGEDVALVTAGQKVSFQGVREGDEIVYDVLLKGKKIPRGKLGLVEELSAEEKKRYSSAQEKKEEAQRRQKIAAQKKAQEQARDPKDICERPYGKLNQCAWECLNNPRKEKKRCRLEDPKVQCVRKRCNANGEWAEETPIRGEKAQNICSAQPQVRECDY